MPKRKCFYSFHYNEDAWRASQVRNVGTVEGNSPASDNNWETLTKGGDAKIKKWIADQMKGRTCAVVLVGEKTASRPWIRHEIVEAWKAGMGVVGIRIHGLKGADKQTSSKGENPFDKIDYGKKKLSSVVKCYAPDGSTSSDKYDWIKEHLAAAVEEAIKIRTDEG